jgi:hypothetical protein
MIDTIINGLFTRAGAHTLLCCTMSDTIINGLFTLAGAGIGVLYAYLSSRKDRIYQNNKKLVAQVTSYWQLEKLYSAELANLTKANSKTVMQSYRDKVEDLGYERPTMTESGAKKLL